MLGVPRDRLGEAAIERDPRLPAELAPDLRPVEDVPAVVAGPVGDDRLQVGGLPELGEHRVRDLLDALLDARAHVVRLAHAAPLEHRLDGGAVVEGVDPFAPVLGGRVHLQRLVVEGARHEDREHLLGELIGPVVVGAVRDRHGQAVRLVVGAHRVVGARLRRVVRRPGPVRRRLGEQVLAVEREIAVHLARRDVMEAPDPDRARRLEQCLRPHDVGAEEQASGRAGCSCCATRRRSSR